MPVLPDFNVGWFEAGARIDNPFFPLVTGGAPHALARRAPLRATDTMLRVGDLELDLLKRCVTRRGELIDLRRASTGSSSISCSMRARWSRAPCSSSRSDTFILSRRRAWSRPTSAGCARRSTSHSART
jgi:hypothetical protein